LNIFTFLVHGADFCCAVAKFYSGKSTFTCIGHPSITLKPSQINDNSCDCPDGSDEPGTAACSYLDPLSPEQPLPSSLTGTTNTTNVLPGFWCANEGHVGSYVPFIYVNDGVCDYSVCCDGSEEFAHVGGVKCENRCGPIGKEFRRLEEDRKQARQRATKVRQALVVESRDLREKVQVKIGVLSGEIKSLEVKRDELKAKLEEVERQERGKVVQAEGQGGKLGVLLGLSKKRVGELRDALDDVLDQRDDLQDKVDELEAILSKFKEEYNPNFNDEGVKSAVKAWEDYAAKTAGDKKAEDSDADILELLKEDGENSGINWNEFVEEEGSDADIRKYPDGLPLWRTTD
jgi:protein kinase C substrate 80K-H